MPDSVTVTVCCVQWAMPKSVTLYTPSPTRTILPRLDVAVQYTAAVGFKESRRHLLANARDAFLEDLAAFQQHVQILTLKEFVSDPGHAVFDIVVQDDDDVGVAEAGGDQGFVPEAHDRVLAGQRLGVQDLDRRRPVEVPVQGQVNAPESPGRQQPLPHEPPRAHRAGKPSSSPTDCSPPGPQLHMIVISDSIRSNSVPIVATAQSTCSGSITKGGLRRSVLGPAPSSSKPRWKQRSTSRSRRSGAGCLVALLRTISTPIISPLPRTSPINLEVCANFCT